jgi:hypothetical protein
MGSSRKLRALLLAGDCEPGGHGGNGDGAVDLLTGDESAPPHACSAITA